VAVTSIVAKMSMVIPIAVAVFLFHDSMNTMKIIGILLALAAVYLSGSSADNDKKTTSRWYLPLLVFIGSGLVDTAVNLAQHYYINESNQQLYISMMFASAGIIGTVLSIVSHRKKKNSLSFASVAGGIILGVINYFSLYFLVKCLAIGIESSFVFSVVNLLVVIMSAVFAFTLFREKPDFRRVTGIGLAILAIIVLYY
ncbi:MAG: EamA family transporter, partial [Bacteroidota bacterium]